MQPTFTAQELRRWSCRCGCGLSLPCRSGFIEDADGIHDVEIFAGHDEGKPSLKVVLRSSLPTRRGVFGFRITIDSEGTTQWRPQLEEELPPTRLIDSQNEAQHPADWDGDDGAVPLRVKRLRPIFDADPICLWHLYGARENDRELDFTFRLPSELVGAAAGSFRANKNFAEHGHRRFVRALTCFPVVGGEFRVGTWFEVAPADFQAVYDAWEDHDEYMKVRIDGQVANRFAVQGHDIFKAQARLAPRTPTECLFVISLDAPPYRAALNCPLTPDELNSLRSELHRSVALGALPRH